MHRYALIGAAGFIAPRHLKAMKDTGGALECCIDLNDSVGILDSYFPRSAFFTEFDQFDDHIRQMKKSGSSIDTVSVCSPNFLHNQHIMYGLRSGSNVICEKPLVIQPEDLNMLAVVEKETGKTVNTILQLRLHPAIRALKAEIKAAGSSRKKQVLLTYVTSRGPWYNNSWKGDQLKSGGIAANIGVHFFDVLHYLFGQMERFTVHLRAPDCVIGSLEYEGANVQWLLSINEADIPDQLRGQQRTYRSLTMDGKEIEFSAGFGDLHTSSYQAFLDGYGFGIEDVRSSVETVYAIKDCEIIEPEQDAHPWLATVIGDEQRYADRT
ncbi:MAG: Gfo/Idh/MocA family protein [Alphaproteobacteria bacterium]